MRKRSVQKSFVFGLGSSFGAENRSTRPVQGKAQSCSEVVQLEHPKTRGYRLLEDGSMCAAR